MKPVNLQPRRRIAGLATLLVLAFLGLAGWLGFVQLVQHERLQKLAADNLHRKILRPARRGAILDRRGTVLATSVPTKTVCADPSLIYDHHDLVARTLAPVLDLTELDLWQSLQPRVRLSTNGVLVTNSYVILKRKVPLDQWQQVTQAMGHLDLGLAGQRVRSSLRLAANALRSKAIFGVEDHLRQYPSGSLAAHVLGYVSGGETETDHGRVFEDHGVTGIELTLDELLTGVHGWRKKGEDMAPTHGLNVVLTLDAIIQNIVEDELAKAYAQYSPEGVCALVVRPRTGEVLALANLPTFDPNDPGRGLEGQRNRAISDIFEPGSTFKIVTMATALNDRRLSLGETVFCENGRWLYGGRYLHDHRSHGMLSFEEVIAQSSNIGTAKAALRLGAGRLYQTVTNFGFGRITGIPLPAEENGRLRPTNAWSKLSITRIPIGHEISATPLQMVMAMSAIANGGVLMQPKLVERLQDESGRVVRQFSPHAVRRVVSETACQQLKRALRTAASEDGTAQAAQLDYYTVAGKTGTTEEFANGNYKSGKYYSSFLGFLPVDQPELCILVGVHRPDRRVGHFGGTVAAPVFRAIAERAANYLRIPPDILPEPGQEPVGKPKGEPVPELVNRQTASAKPTGSFAPALAR